MLSTHIVRRYPLRRRVSTAQSLRRLLANQDGLRCDYAELALEIVTEDDNTARLRFFFDSGADLMVIPAYVARHEHIRYREDYPGTIGSSVGGSVPCYYDFVQVRSSLSGRTHRWVCAFTESLQGRLIVGRAGFLSDFAAGVRAGQFIVSHPVSVGRFLTHHAAGLRAPTGDAWAPI